jgi:hypothetical protein
MVALWIYNLHYHNLYIDKYTCIKHKLVLARVYVVEMNHEYLTKTCILINFFYFIKIVSTLSRYLCVARYVYLCKYIQSRQS